MSDFYVYIYRKPCGMPFYVGKGKGDRAYHHLTEARKEITTDTNRLKINIIQKILREGNDPTIQFVETGMDEEKAFEFECVLISEIGSVDLGTGTLANMTDGGEGSVGYKHSKQAIEKIRFSQKEKIVSDETKRKLSEYVSKNNPMFLDHVREKVSGENHWAYGKPARNKGIPMPEEQKRKLSIALSGENHPFYGKPCTKERREAISSSAKGVKKTSTVNMRKPKKKEMCLHCKKMVDGGNLRRWHNDNCKMKGV